MVAVANGFEYPLRLDGNGNGDDCLQQAFADIARGAQAALRCAASLANDVQVRSQELVADNLKLREEVRQLRKELGPVEHQPSALGQGTKSTPAPPQRPTQTASPVIGSIDTEAFTATRGLSLSATLPHDGSPVHAVAAPLQASGERQVVATGTWAGDVRVFDLGAARQPTHLRTLRVNAAEGSSRGVYAVAFCPPQPNLVGCASADGCVHIWDFNNGERVTRLAGHKDEVNDLDFHEEQSVACTASDDHQLLIWDIQSASVLRTFSCHRKEVYGCRFMGMEHQYNVASCCFDRKTRIFDMRDEQVIACLMLHGGDVIGIDHSAKARMIATSSDDGLIGVWDSRSWKMVHRIAVPPDPIGPVEVKRVAFSPDGKLLAAGLSSGQAVVYDVSGPTATLAATLSGHSKTVFGLAWSRCPKTGGLSLVSTSHDGAVCQWRWDS